MSGNVIIETEVECLDGPPDGSPTYSRRLRTHMEEFQKFARWNSSLFYIIGFMIILISCGVLAYFFIYNKDIGIQQSSAYQDQQEMVNGCENSGKIGNNIPKLHLITLFSSENAEGYCFANETENVALKLKSTNDSDSWETWEFGCKNPVVQLSLEGQFPPNSLLHFDKLFGSSVMKIRLYGPEICSSTSELDLNVPIFKEIKSISVYNTTEQCDSLLNGFLGSLPKNLVTVKFISALVTEQLEIHIKNLVSSKQISELQLQDLHYPGN